MNDNLPTSSEASDPLDSLLRESEVHLADDGFTARVLTSLPSRRRSEGPRLAILGTAWVAGVVILLRHSPVVGTAEATFLQHARHGEVSGVLALAPVLIVAGMLVWVLVTWALEEWA